MGIACSLLMNETHDPAFGFLEGGGEMRTLIRAFDWGSTPLGPIRQWPQSLRTALGLLLNSRYPMFVFWGPHLIKIYNDAYRPVLGDKHPWALGRPGPEVWPEIWGDIHPLVERALGEDPTWSDDLQLFLLRRGFLEEVYFTFSYSPIHTERGGVGGMFCACSETTSQVLGERRLRALSDLAARPADARTVVDACALSLDVLDRYRSDVPFALLYLIDADGQAARLSASAGVRSDHSSAPSVVRLNDGSGWPLFQVASTREATQLRGLGEIFDSVPEGPWPEPPSAAMLLPIVDRGLERSVGVLVLGISSRRPFDEDYREWFELVAQQVGVSIANARASEEERKRAEALAELDRAKTAFFSNVSHEFRTPLTLMLGPVEEALATPDRTLQGDRLEVVHRNAVRLLKLVNTLLDFSRIEEGRERAVFEPVDLAALTNELAGVFRSTIERAGLRLLVHCDPLPELVYVDADMWEKVVLNLLSNAFKFTFEGEIEVRLRPSDQWVELQVRDTGIGVDPVELPRLFERFYRVEGTRSRTYEGSGIGLALVRELVRLHGGEIDVESEIGQGTTFTIKLKRGHHHLPHGQIGAGTRTFIAAHATAFVEEAAAWLSGMPGAAKGPANTAPAADTSRTGGRILVADDNGDMRDYVTRLLSERWTVEAVPDGIAALARLQEQTFDLVLADVMMPGLDGFELLNAVRTDPATAQTPFVMLSARAGEEARIVGLQAGADDYMVKPFSGRELEARVGAQLEAGRLRRALERERQRLYGLFQRSPAAIVVLEGPAHRVVFANGRYCDLTGRSTDELLHHTLVEKDDTFAGSGLLRTIDLVFATGETAHQPELELMGNSKGDSTAKTRYFDWTCQATRGTDGRIDGTVQFFYDVTDKVLSRDVVSAARRSAESANRAKDEFLAMLGHELRNPLAPIVTALELMRMRGGESREQDIIERQVAHLGRLVDDLLDVSRIARGKIRLEKRRTSLAALVSRAIETASPLFEHHNQRLEVQVPQTGLELDVDPDRIAQVIANLLTNASKYSADGSRVTITAESVGGVVRLRVHDQGVGIAKDMLSRVFDMFVQQPQAADRASGGLGLGLTIVKNLVEMHGGRVSAKSEGLGKGSEFSIELPLASPAVETQITASPSMPPGPLAYPRAKRIMVVDDNHDAAAMLKSALELMGFLVRVAHDGPSALELAESFQPQIGVVDIGLPVMDGYELAERFRNRAAGSGDMRLVAVTGYGQDADRQRSERAGFARHLVKPIDLVELQAAIAD
jgi:signal transduction histidine kinase/ActR/RegA family two-component response regulator